VDNFVEKPVDTMLISPQVPVQTQYEVLSNTNPLRHCLLVDDVVTTGSTLKKCMEAAAAKKNFEFTAVTYARTRR
jgi:predicted amidophosphoribosyltransferase